MYVSKTNWIEFMKTSDLLVYMFTYNYWIKITYTCNIIFLYRLGYHLLSHKSMAMAKIYLK